MALVKPARSRVQVVREPGRLRVVVRVPCNVPATAFLAVWLCGWAVGEVFAARQLFLGKAPVSGQLFLLFWLTLWTVGGAVAIYTFAWSLVGREEIAVDGRVLAIRQAAGPFGRTREYDLAHVQDLRAAPMGLAGGQRFGQLAYPGMNRGELAFDYGAKTYRLGTALDGQDVKTVLQALGERLPVARAAS